MLRHAAALASDADPAAAWALLARPDRWHEWAPHLRGAWGLAGPDGEVARGRTGAARLLGALPVPATITAKEPGRSWTWRVGAVVTMEHRVEDRHVVVEISAPPPLETVLAATYGPLVQRLVERLAEVSRSAAAPPRPTGTGTPAG
jgi:Polyketide cyclase / dehydrase and lipid transport